MRSPRRIEPLDSFEADVPITREDIEAQARIARERTMSTVEFLDWCSWLTRDHVAPCRDFHSEPFEL